MEKESSIVKTEFFDFHLHDNENDFYITVDVKSKGKAFFKKKKKEDSNFSEQKYLENFVEEAIKSFMKDSSKRKKKK